MKSTSLVRIGSRNSALAMAQTQQVINAVNFNLEYQIVPIVSSGDKIAGNLRDHGGKSLFTKELDFALLNGEIDLAVHSMKDVETPLLDGLEIAAVPFREDPRDVLLYKPNLDLANLPLGTTIGTSSLRRGCQLSYYLENIEIAPCRGNIQTRLQKFSEGMSGIVLAVAGLKRMGLFNNGLITGIKAETMVLDTLKYVPAAGQGALVVIKRVGDNRFDDYLSKINHQPSRFCIEVERQVVEGLNVTCHDPIGVYANIVGEDIHVHVMLFRQPVAVYLAQPIIMKMVSNLSSLQSNLEKLIKDTQHAVDSTIKL
jgi:hydroxymethylbilane synthase